MYTIRIIVHCPDEHAEVLPGSLEDAAYAIEESIGLLLLELFGTVLVDKVSVTYSPSEDVRDDILPPAA